MTADFLLSKPVGRPQILTSKLLAAALTSLLVTTLVVGGISFVAIGSSATDITYEPHLLLLLLLALVVFDSFSYASGWSFRCSSSVYVA